MSRFLEAALVLTLTATPVLAGKYNLGRPATDDEIAAWDIDVRPDGLGLPPGSGSVEVGEEVFSTNCAQCHGEFGEAVGRWPVLAGGQGTLQSDDPNKTIGSYWPYLSTVYDYIHRAMPFGNAQSLTPDQVYAITAYLLYMNDVVGEDFVLSNENFTSVRLPNQDHFFEDDRDTTEVAEFTREPCMTDCKETVEITARAAVIDVTPEDAAARARVEAAQRTEEEAAAPEEPAADPALVAAGEKIFARCKSCHQIGRNAKNRTGPELNGIIGRPVGSVESFTYSKAMIDAHDAGKVWDKAALAAFLADPRRAMKGTRMSFAGLKKDEEIAALIAYLEDVGG